MVYWKFVFEFWFLVVRFGWVDMNILFNESGGWVFFKEIVIVYVEGEVYVCFNDFVK